MAVFADSADQKVDAAVTADQLFIRLAFFGKVRRLSVQKMNVAFFYVDMVEKVFPQEVVVALFVFGA